MPGPSTTLVRSRTLICGPQSQMIGITRARSLSGFFFGSGKYFPILFLSFPIPFFLRFPAQSRVVELIIQLLRLLHDLGLGFTKSTFKFSTGKKISAFPSIQYLV